MGSRDLTGDIVAVVEASLTRPSSWTAVPRTRQYMSRLLVVVAAADLAAISLAIALAWDYRFGLDTLLASGQGSQPLAAFVAPSIGLVWMLLLAADGAYSTRSFGA